MLSKYKILTKTKSFHMNFINLFDINKTLPIFRVVPDISASQDNDTWDTVGMQSSGAGSKRKPKKAFTVWSTLFSTYTVTTTSYFQGTTVSVSGVCSVSGLGSSCFG